MFAVKPRIWSTFIFGTEADLDMLECHLYEMAGTAYRFVIAEARIDHQGHPKPLWLRDNWERFAPWHDQIIHVEADLSGIPPSPGAVTYWPFEEAQRNAISAGLADVAPEDWILHGDCDEIPKPDMICPGMVLGAQHHAYALEWECRDGWRSLVCHRSSDAPKAIRDMRYSMGHLPVLDHASWHLSWFGGIPEALKKFDTTLHADIPREVRDDCASGWMVRDGWHWQGHYRKLHPYRGDDFPKWVRDGREPTTWHRSGQLAALAGSR